MTASATGTDELPVISHAVPVAQDAVLPRARPEHRRAVRAVRRQARRQRRLYVLGGLAVLAAFLAATVVVVDMVR